MLEKRIRPRGWSPTIAERSAGAWLAGDPGPATPLGSAGGGGGARADNCASSPTDPAACSPIRAASGSAVLPMPADMLRSPVTVRLPTRSRNPGLARAQGGGRASRRQSMAAAAGRPSVANVLDSAFTDPPRRPRALPCPAVAPNEPLKYNTKKAPRKFARIQNRFLVCVTARGKERKYGTTYRYMRHTRYRGHRIATDVVTGEN